jgi:transposase
MLRALCFRWRQLSEEELEMLSNARAEWDEFDRAFPLVQEFVKIIRGQSSMKLSLWIVSAFDSKARELRSFANGLQKDFPPVKEAIVSPWSNGETEGQVNRLKLLKRQMYGRAKFDLLKAIYIELLLYRAKYGEKQAYCTKIAGELFGVTLSDANRTSI